MSIVAPKGRKHLSADALFRLVRNGFAGIPDHRAEETGISCADALMSAFALFSLKSPSLLAFDKERVEGNLHTIYGIARAPCDTHMREMLDPVSPESVRPVFTGVFRQLQRGKVLEPMLFLNGYYLLALDGTGYFSSTTIHCQSCLHKVHRNGSMTYSHQMLGAAIIHPDFRVVIPLMPEPIIKQDGTEKNDCERNAAKRFIAKLRQDHPHLKFIVTEDGLSSNAPHIETGAFILQRHRQPWFSIPLLSPVWSAVFSSRNQFQVGTSRRHLGECGLVIALILLGFMERPIRIEIAIDHQRSEFENGFASFQSPPGPREIHTIFHQITTSPFDHPRGDGIPLGQGVWIVEVRDVIGQVGRALIDRFALFWAQSLHGRPAT